jgi:hypothetical protein
MNQHTWEILNYNDYFIQYLQIDPQLTYDTEKKELLKLQELLLKKYNNKIYTRGKRTIN